MEVTTNIFIAHTPLQNYIASEIVNQSTGLDYNILFTSVKLGNVDSFDQVILIEKTNGPRKLFQTFQAKRFIEKLIRNGAKRIFISHTSGLLDNYVFYSLKEKQKCLDINFYYDGILYFYEYSEKFQNRHKTLKVMGFLLGINYLFEPMVFPHDSDKISNIYTILPEFTLGDPQKHIKVELRKRDFRPTSQNILILGGKPTKLTDEEVKSIYRAILEIISSNPHCNLYFKGHHADKSNIFQKIIDKIPYSDITQDSPIEEVIEDYLPETIYSYPSSALINLKTVYGDKIEVSAFYIKRKSDDIMKLSPIFEALNINLTLI